jgi:REP element-mobilizing transposase RayT
MPLNNFDGAGRNQTARQPVFEIGNLSPIIFLTVCTSRRKPIFANAKAHELLCDSWRKANHWSIGKYVILPDHIHLFCSPATQEVTSIRKWVQYWKALVSQAWPNRWDHPIWQKDIWDTQLRRGDNYREKWEYVQNNPVRHGLVESAEQWPYQGEIKSLMWHDR